MRRTSEMMGRRMVLFAFLAVCGVQFPVAGLTINQRSITDIAGASTDQNGAGFTVTGLSGIAYAGGNTFWGVMDNSNKLVQLNVTFGADGSIASAAVVGGVTMATAADHEGIAIAPGAASVYVSDETVPGVKEYRLSDGALLQTLPTPAVFNNLRTNFGLESLSRTGNALWTANEEALSTDGSLSDEAAGTLVRLQRFSLSGATATAGAQYAYLTAPIHTDAKDVPPRDVSDQSRSGLSDLVALPDGRLLALERSFARKDFIVADAGSEYLSRIYLLDPAGATDVSGFANLSGGGFTSVTKSATPLWSYSTSIFGGSIGNLEGLTLGPQLPNGGWTLLGIVDDGDGVLSNNTLVSFELVGSIPEPAAASALLLAGFLLNRRR